MFGGHLSRSLEESLLSSAKHADDTFQALADILATWIYVEQTSHKAFPR